MKYLIALIVGLIAGVALLLAGLYFNPFATRQSLSPLAVANERMVVLKYTLAPSELLLFTNDGESVRKPHPQKVQQLWEPAVRKSWVSVAEMSNARGEVVGIGIKFSSDSEKTRPLRAQALVDSIWHIYLPASGTVLVQQVENYWPLLHDIVIPARWSSSDSWRGTWHGNITAGQGALGTARVTGQTGTFAGVEAEAVETLNVTVYSAVDGPAAMTGTLMIAMPSAGSGK